MNLPASFWKTASVLFAAVALAKGLRAPNIWSLTQMQISYSSGFVKRGLLGECLQLVGIRSLAAVELFCFVQLALLVLLLTLLLRQSRLLHVAGSPVLVCAACGSYALTFLAHLNGYLDIVLYVLALVLLLIRRPGLRLILAVPISVAAILIHENFLLTALPPILLSFLLDGRRSGRARQGFVRAALLFALCAGLAFLVSAKGRLSPAALTHFKAETIARSAYTLDPGVLDVVGMSTRANLSLNWSVISHMYWWWAELAVALATCGPLLWMLLAAMRRNEPSAALRAALYGASLAPLLLNVIGWDDVRWVVLSVLSSFLNLCLLTRDRAAEPAYRIGTRESQAAVLVLGLGLASGHGLMDHTSINPYPFFPRVIRHRVILHDGELGSIL